MKTEQHLNEGKSNGGEGQISSVAIIYLLEYFATGAAVFSEMMRGVRASSIMIESASSTMHLEHGFRFRVWIWVHESSSATTAMPSETSETQRERKRGRRKRERKEKNERGIRKILTKSKVKDGRVV